MDKTLSIKNLPSLSQKYKKVIYSEKKANICFICGQYDYTLGKSILLRIAARGKSQTKWISWTPHLFVKAALANK